MLSVMLRLVVEVRHRLYSLLLSYLCLFRQLPASEKM